jgi:hypothetical protein
MIAHPAMCSASAAKSRLWVEPPTPLGAGGAGNGARVVGAVGLDQLQTPFEVAGLDRPDKGVDDQPRGRPAGLSDLPLANRPRWSRTPSFACCICSRSGIANSAAIVAASPNEIMPPASAEVTAFIAGAMSAASIGGEANMIVRSRHGGRTRSRQSRIADERQRHGLVGQGLGLAREQCRAGDGRLVAAATRRPAGLLDRPFSNGRPHPPRRFGVRPSVIGISPWSNGRAVSVTAPRQGVCKTNLTIS